MIRIPVPEDCAASDDPYDLVWAFTVSVNDLLAMPWRPEELPAEAMQSYYVDFFHGQAGNGGLSQFIVNSQWDPELLDYLETGLEQLGAVGHLELLRELADEVSAWLGGGDGGELEEVLQSGEATARLEALDARRSACAESEDLLALTHAFIRDRGLHQPVAQSDYEAAMDRLREEVPEREERLAELEREVREQESDEVRLVREICELAGQKLLSFDGVFLGVFEKEKVPEVHVTTDAGKHFLVIHGGRARLFDAESREPLGEWEMES